jgi:hypothetical protein
MVCYPLIIPFSIATSQLNLTQLCMSVGASECTACLIGTYQDREGRESCVKCPAGRATKLTAQEKCEECPTGSAQQSEGSTECTICTLGKYSGVAGKPRCDDCEAGRYQDVVGSSLCKETPVGNYSESGLPLPKKCAPRTIAPYAGLSSCYACEVNSESSANNDRCICQASYYAERLDNLNATIVRCNVCPTGAYCVQSGVTFDTLLTDDGYWRANNESLLFYRCLLATQCVRGRSASCESYRTGPLCSLCIDGYRSSTSTSECKKCPASNEAWGTTVGLCAVVVVVAIALYVYVLAKDQPMMMAIEERDASQIEWDNDEELLNQVVGPMSRLSVAAQRMEALAAAASGEAAKKRNEHSMESRMRPNFTYKLKIILGFMQVASGLPFLVSVPWPSYFSSFIQFFNFGICHFRFHSPVLSLIADYFEMI